MHAVPLSAGRLDLGFAPRHGRTVLTRRHYSYPFTISRAFHLDTAPAGMATVIVQTVSGSLNAGDQLAQRFEAEAGAEVHLTTQGAGAVYRATGPGGARERVDIIAHDGAVVEYLPDPRILFPDADLAQRTVLHLGEEALVLLADSFVMHDPLGTGRPFRRYAQSLEIRTAEGKLLAADSAEIDGLPKASGRRAHFRAFGTLTVATLRDPTSLAGLAAALTAGIGAVATLYGSVSPLPNGCGLSVRLAAPDGRVLRQGLEAGWIAARQQFFGAPPASRGNSK